MKKINKEERQASPKIDVNKERIKFVQEQREKLDKEFIRFGFTPTAYTEGKPPHAPAPHLIGWIFISDEFTSEIVINQETCTITYDQNQRIKGEMVRVKAGFLSPLTDLIWQATHLYHISKDTQKYNEYIDWEKLNASIIPGTNGDAS